MTQTTFTFSAKKPWHYAKVKKSPRLQAVLLLLKQRGEQGATSWEIVTFAHVVNPGGAISELKANGYDIDTIGEGKNEQGRKVFRYILKGKK